MADADFTVTVADTAELSRGDQWLIRTRSLTTTSMHKDIKRARTVQRQGLDICTSQASARHF